MTDDADVIVVGAGIAGLGLACALARFDVRVLLIERRRGAGGIHRGDSLLPQSTRWLARWGVLDAVIAAQAQPIGRLEIHHGLYGKVCEVPLADPLDPDPYIVLPHARIEEVLLERALAFGRTTLVRPAKVTDLLREGGAVVGVRYEMPEGPREARARLVVATDGHRSVVRERLGIEAAPCAYDHAYLGLEADRPASYENAMRVHFHEEGGVLLMPRPTRVGIGMLVEAGSGKLWIGMSDDELRAAVVARAPVLEGLAIHRAGSHVYELSRSHAPRYRKDGAVVIGDAAHTTNPTAGQGMTMALGDAGRLAEIVGPALERRARDLSPLLAAYEAEQWPRNERTIRRSHLLARIYALRGGRWDRLKIETVRALATPFAQRLVRKVLRTFLKPASSAPAPAPVPVPVPETVS